MLDLRAASPACVDLRKSYTHALILSFSFLETLKHPFQPSEMFEYSAELDIILWLFKKVKNSIFLLLILWQSMEIYGKSILNLAVRTAKTIEIILHKKLQKMWKKTFWEQYKFKKVIFFTLRNNSRIIFQVPIWSRFESGARVTT